jgi:PAS domain S-box-containing protein
MHLVALLPAVFEELLSSDGFMPHGHCYLWKPGLVALHVVSDALTALAYTSIPFTLVSLARRRRDVPFNWIFLCFGVFIVACGATHGMEIWTLWTPTYWLAGVIKAVTAIASVATAVLLARLLPHLLAIPTGQQLAAAHEALREAHEVLEVRVQERTAELGRKNEDLHREIEERRRAETVVTALRQEAALRESEERYRLLFEKAGKAIYIVGADGEHPGAIVDANETAARIHGYTVAELRTTDIRALLPPETAARAGEGLRNLLADGWSMGEVVHARKDGSRFPAEYTAGPLDLEGKRCVLVFLDDVTEQKQAVDELRTAKESAELANRELESFSYSVAHDLRAPLRGMSGFAQALFDDHADELDAEALDFLHRIQADARRMGELIDALLSLSRVTRTELRRERVDLSAVARAVTASLAAAEPERLVDVVVEGGLLADVDLPLTRTLLENLLGNAWKFTGKVAAPRIEVGVTHQDGATVFFVRDNGAGFDMTYAGKLFGTFQRLHSVRDFPGTGIGLATVQRIVRRHGGRIWAHGAVGDGAIFHFTLADG